MLCESVVYVAEISPSGTERSVFTHTSVSHTLVFTSTTVFRVMLLYCDEVSVQFRQTQTLI